MVATRSARFSRCVLRCQGRRSPSTALMLRAACSIPPIQTPDPSKNGSSSSRYPTVNHFRPKPIGGEVPWGVVHHHFWRPLNGSLFMARDILGNVRISDNQIFDAYNGIRTTLSDQCLRTIACIERTSLGFEIARNTFENIRDNPVEPEDHMAFWIVKHNTFINAHAVISTDGVSGHDLLVFGNFFVMNSIPGSNCHAEGWVGSRQFVARRGGGEW